MNPPRWHFPGILLVLTLSLTGSWKVTVEDPGTTRYGTSLSDRDELFPGPDTLPVPQWQEDRYFPIFPSTDHVYAFEIEIPIGNGGGAWKPEWRIDQSLEVSEALTLVSMQGLINRFGPRVYLDWKDRVGHYDESISGTWLAELKNHVEVSELDMTKNAVIDFLHQTFPECFSGVVIYDPDVPETINIAAMISGLENRIVMGPHQGDQATLSGYEDIVDLRTLVTNEEWDNSFDSVIKIYQWVYDNLWPRLEKRMISFASTGPPTSIDRETEADDFRFPLALGSRDYDIALKLAVLYLNPKYADHEALLGQFLEDAESPIAITGVSAFNEFGVVKNASKFGNFVAASAWPGQPISAGNLTVHAGVRPEIIPYAGTISDENILATLENRPVITMFSSDGDAVFFQMDRGFHPFFRWDDVKHQPFSWETNPLLAQLAPIAWNYYQRTTEGAHFSCGLSGAGYMNPQLMDEEELSRYLDRTAVSLAETGLRVVRLDGNNGPIPDSYLKLYYDKLNTAGYLGAIQSFLPPGEGGISLKYPGSPAPVMQEAFTLEPANSEQVMQDLLQREPGRSVAKVTQQSPAPHVSWVEDSSAAGGIAILVKKSFFNSASYSLIYSTGNLILFPGDYTVTCRMKVSDNSSAATVAHIGATIDINNPEESIQLASISIPSTSFDAAGVYQDFVIHFSLEEVTELVEIRIDYGDGSTDLYLDNITIENSNPDLPPVMAPLYLSLALNPDFHDQMTDLAENFALQFESAGGLILSPNEFFAALNPDWMLEFAREIITTESQDSLLDIAAIQLEQQAYHESLITTRKALRQFVNTVPLDEVYDDSFKFNTFPNPSSDLLHLSFHLLINARVKVDIISIDGKHILTVMDEFLTQGDHYFTRHPSLPPGLYICRLLADGEVKSLQKISFH